MENKKKVIYIIEKGENMQKIRARVVSQERDLYRIKSEKGEIFAEVSGKF